MNIFGFVVVNLDLRPSLFIDKDFYLEYYKNCDIRGGSTMKKVAIIASIILIICLVGGLVFLWPRDTRDEGFVKTDYESMDLGETKKLMVIAHPDDDVLWGGAELIGNDYLVVCITCGSSAKRVAEFEAVMERTKDKYVMLGYPDKTNGERDNWDSVHEDIIDDIEKIYALRDWEMVLTHNPKGEYGHQHHKMTNAIVTDAVAHDKLFYFGKYYSKKDLENEDNVAELEVLDEDVLKEKEDILNLYTSQDNTIHKTFGHMLKYENVISYEDWMDKYEENEE